MLSTKNDMIKDVKKYKYSLPSDDLYSNELRKVHAFKVQIPHKIETILNSYMKGDTPNIPTSDTQTINDLDIKLIKEIGIKSWERS